jgi:hypothetical protein
MIASLNFSQRLASGQVTAVHSFALDLDLSLPLNGIRRARINRDHWLDPDHKWTVGDTIASLFVYDLSSEAKVGQGGGHWFSSQRWSKREGNPWDDYHIEHPTKGREYQAQVIAHAGKRTAVLRLGSNLLEGYLSLDDVPLGRFSEFGIDELLPPGLRLRVLVKEVDPNRLDITLSVLQLLAQLQSRQGDGPHQVGDGEDSTAYLRFVDTSKKTTISQTDGQSANPPDWHDYGILLIDNDPQFGKNLVAWCHQFGAKAWYAGNPQTASELLRQQGDKISHILVDYDVGERTVRAQILTLLKPLRGTTPIALISGIPEAEAPAYATKYDFGFMAKPIRFDMLQNWLQKGELPPWQRQTTQPASYWQHHANAYTQRLQQAAQSWLQASARLCDAMALLWIRCYHPEYQLLAHVGLPPAAILPPGGLLHLAQSVVADAAQLGTAHASQNNNDALKTLWPPQARQVWALPLHESPDGGSADDVLLVFLKEPADLPQCQLANLHDLHAWWLTLLALERTQESLAEDAVFATQGRVHSASLHELRPLLQPFEGHRQWDAQAARDWWPQGKKVSHLVNSGLYNIRPERSQRIDLHDRIATLMRTFLWQMISERQVTVVMHLPPPELVIFLPPEVLEQPLINLIDNATKFCAHRHWAKVEVRFYIDTNDAKLPLVIQVSDQGTGMTPEQLRHLFHPRHSASGEKGHGLGLYVSHSLVKAVGGDLRLLESWRWAGTTFEVRLPLNWGGH